MKALFVAILLSAGLIVALSSSKPVKDCIHYGPGGFTTRNDAEASRNTWKQENATKIIVTSSEDTEIFGSGNPPFIPYTWNYRVTYTADKCLPGD